MFEIKKQVLKTPEQAYKELLGDSKENQIVEIPLELIDEIENQPQHIHEDKIKRISESMKIVGQLDPVIVIPNNEIKGRYLLLAGRHRCRACEMNGLPKVKAVVKQETNPDKQRLMLLATNNDRNTDYSPSELAFSYKEQMELLQKLGSKSTASQIAEDNNTNRKSVHKYIQLTKLIKPLLYKVDKGELTVGAGYELSFLTDEQQNKVFIYLVNNPETHISKDNARIIRDNPEKFKEIFYSENNSSGPKNTILKESPKAEKKTNNISSKDKCPSEGHKKPEISYEMLMTIAFTIYRECYSIYKYIVKDFPTSDESINFIIQRYAENGTVYNGTLSEKDIPFNQYQHNYYKIEFLKNKISVVLSSKANGIIKIKLSYKEVDSATREYLRKYISVDDIIYMLREK